MVLRLDQSLDMASKRQRLLTLEAHLKQTVEPILHVYLEPTLDKNQPRQTQGVKL